MREKSTRSFSMVWLLESLRESRRPKPQGRWKRGSGRNYFCWYRFGCVLVSFSSNLGSMLTPIGLLFEPIWLYLGTCSSILVPLCPPRGALGPFGGPTQDPHLSNFWCDLGCTSVPFGYPFLVVDSIWAPFWGPVGPYIWYWRLYNKFVLKHHRNNWITHHISNRIINKKQQINTETIKQINGHKTIHSKTTNK